MSGIKSVDALRSEADAFLAQDDPEAYAKLVKEREDYQREQMEQHRRDLAVAEAQRRETGSEAAEGVDDEDQGQGDAVRTGLAQEVHAAGDDLQGGSAGVPESGAGTGVDAVKPEPISRITMVNGAQFALGEFIPWKGIHFQVIHLEKGFIGIQAVGLTNVEIKRMLKARSNA